MTLFTRSRYLTPGGTQNLRFAHRTHRVPKTPPSRFKPAWYQETMVTGPETPESGDFDERMPKIPGATLAEIERYAILQTLKLTRGSTSKAAQILGVSVRTIQYRLLSYRQPSSGPTGPMADNP